MGKTLKRRGLGENQVLRSSQAYYKLLHTLLTPSTFNEIVEKTGMSTATVSKYLTLMKKCGLVEKVLKEDKIFYTLTWIGRKHAHEKVTPIEMEVMRRLYLEGAILDLRGRSTVGLNEESDASKDLMPSFVQLEKIEREYLNFLAELYVHSVKKFLDKVEGELSFIQLRAAWQALELDAWMRPVKKEGLYFDYKTTWEKFYGRLDNELKQKLMQLSLNERTIFMKLYAFSFPQKERARLLKNEEPENLSR